MTAMLKLTDICKTFNPGTINEKIALNHVNLELEENDFVTMIGGNGAGKSTMLNRHMNTISEGRYLRGKRLFYCVNYAMSYT